MEICFPLCPNRFAFCANQHEGKTKNTRPILTLGRYVFLEPSTYHNLPKQIKTCLVPWSNRLTLFDRLCGKLYCIYIPYFRTVFTLRTSVRSKQFSLHFLQIIPDNNSYKTESHSPDIFCFLKLTFYSAAQLLLFFQTSGLERTVKSGKSLL